MPSKELIIVARAISRLLGWTYTLAWSLSFYPQPLLNIRRKSVTGTAIDFPTINVLGFFCYLVSTAAFLYSPVIREQYAIRNPVSPEPTVRGNDLAFAIHAMVLSALTWSMFFPKIWGFSVDGRRQRVSKTIAGVFLGSVMGLLAIVCIVWFHGGNDANSWAWIDVIYAFSFVKLLITLVKYMPQVHVNYIRKSTVGWSIWQILLDLTGGVLSIAQLLIDSSLQNDWSGLTGNPVKFGLGNISIIFDIIFMLQHYVFYRPAKEVGEGHESGPLLEDDARLSD